MRDRQGLIQIGGVPDSHREIELSHRSVIMQNLAHNLVVRNHDSRQVRMDQGGGKDIYRGHLTVDTDELDVLSDTEGLREDDGQSRHDVPENPLERDAEADTRD